MSHRPDYDREYYQKHHERIKARAKAWRDDPANKARLNEYHKAWRRAHKAKAGAIYRKYQLKWKYGLSLEDFDALLAAQGGRCAICPRVLTVRQACVDHDHTTQAVRGILCQTCNTVLGQMDDSPNLLRRAALYLEQKAAKAS